MKGATLSLLCLLLGPSSSALALSHTHRAQSEQAFVAPASNAPAARGRRRAWPPTTSAAEEGSSNKVSFPSFLPLEKRKGLTPLTATTIPQGQGRQQQQQQQQQQRQRQRQQQRDEYEDDLLEEEEEMEMEEDEEEDMYALEAPRAEKKKPILSTLVELLASKLVRKTARRVSGLDIDVGARSNGDVLAGNLPRVKAKFNRIVLESIQISGGGNMEITGLNIRLLALLLARRLSVIRRPFEVFGQYVLTQQDVSASKLIRDLIQLLVNNVLRTLFPSLHLTFFDVSIDQVRISNQKLAILGTANIAESEGGMPFTLLTGVGLAGDGHIVYLDNPELVLNPDAALPVKVPLGSIRAFDVDIGDNARIERIEIDDKLGVSITARTLITPAPPFQVTDVGKRAAFLYDVGAFFSSFFGFTHFSDLNLER